MLENGKVNKSFYSCELTSRINKQRATFSTYERFFQPCTFEDIKSTYPQGAQISLIVVFQESNEHRDNKKKSNKIITHTQNRTKSIKFNRKYIKQNRRQTGQSV